MLPTALCNQIRGLLAEYGIALTQGVGVLRKRLPELLEDAENGLSDFFRPLLADCYQQLQEIDRHIDFYTQVLKQHAKQNEAIRRLQKIPGFGPVVASVFRAFVGDGQAYKTGRDVSAALGLVPLLVATGPGSEIQRPLAIVVVGGLTTATLLTLILLPLLYRRFGLREVTA